MRTAMLALATLAAVVCAGLFPPGVSQASHPATPRPLLNCADVNADGPVSVSDISRLVQRFGSNDGGAGTWGVSSWTTSSYHPLYDLRIESTSMVGAITTGDIVVAVSDFGLDCRTVSPVDTQIAQATLAVLNYPDPPGGSVCPGSALVTQNITCLAEHGYVGALIDVPGQGIHFIKVSLWDGVLDPVNPEGLVYNNNRLVAHLYFVNGDTVGWGCWPGPAPDCGGDPPPDQVDIDNLDPPCTPQSPNTSCSWAGSGDGWHTHFNLCQIQQGTPYVRFTLAGSAEECETQHNQGKSQGQGGTWTFFDRLGWMGHLWNHELNKNTNPADVAGNGRFADCFPDSQHWTAFNCPQ